MFDIKDPLGLAGIVSAYKLDKWSKVIVSCGIAAFISFWGTLGISGGAMLAATHSVSFALATGFFAACLVMAAAVLRTVQKSGAWRELSIILPEELQTVLEGTDVTQPPAEPTQSLPKPAHGAPENQSARQPALTG